ncbi:hypothetical protein CBM2586_A10286 [Cupriavidus phytorum]|uniref:Uncharacterized protein n=1 Tax=Cupriavidus taiwanensis TaxID=164546 RepID=A0A975WPL1_9BURK|nr:hypothetical protein CBM2586_A10286 [Cupriavidus taiwanensis]
MRDHNQTMTPPVVEATPKVRIMQCSTANKVLPPRSPKFSNERQDAGDTLVRGQFWPFNAGKRPQVTKYRADYTIHPAFQRLKAVSIAVAAFHRFVCPPRESATDIRRAFHVPKSIHKHVPQRMDASVKASHCKPLLKGTRYVLAHFFSVLNVVGERVHLACPCGRQDLLRSP